MASGDLILLDAHKLSVKLLDAVQGTTNGPWVEVHPQYSIWSFHADFPGTDSVSIQVSNAVANPGAGAGAILTVTPGGAAVALTGNTASTTVATTITSAAFRWVRAIKTGNTNTCTVILEADSNQ
jgi:hypothetical protein